MIRIRYYCDEAVDPAVLLSELKTLGMTEVNDTDKIYKALLNAVNPGNPSDKILQAYGSSKKELVEAINLILEYNKALKEKPYSAGEILKKFAKFSEGKLNDSKVLDMAKQLLDNLTDSEFEKVVQAFENDKKATVLRKAPYAVLKDRPKRLFRIKTSEEDRFWKSNDAKVKGLIDKTASKRKIKKTAKKAVNKVSGAVGKAADAVKKGLGKLKDKGGYLAGWLT